jgi:DNA polymerase III sliding clamp (beta) subunit (PCNA family)
MTPGAEVTRSVRVDATSFREALTRVEHAAAKTPERPILNGVLLEGDETGFRAVAADNYRIAVAEIETVSDNGLDFGKAVIWLSECAVIKAFLKGSRDEILLSHSDGTFRIDDHKRTLTVTTIDGQFPNYRAVLGPKPNAIRVGVNPTYLGDLGKIKAESGVVEVWVAAPTDPLRVESRGTGYSEYVMPVRLVE